MGGGDDFLREEFNENFAKLDGEAAWVVFGSYVGAYESAKQTVSRIELGFQPKAVMVVPERGSCSNSGGRSYDGIAGPGIPAIGEALAVDESGFSVKNYSTGSLYLNEITRKYLYMALI